MSLFDTIHCDYPFPDPEFQHEEFQTKDLDCTLDRYRITAGGRLWRLFRRIDLFAKDTPPPEAAEPAEDMNYHGELCFYTSTDKGWLEYDARFTHGTLDWIRRAGEAEPVSADSLARLARDAGALEKEREGRIEALLQRLEQLDPEVAKRAIEVFADRTNAARWLATTHRGLGDETPYRVLAEGQRRAVLEELERIDHGLFG